MSRSYPPEFRRKVLDLLAAGPSVTEVAEDLGISGACIYNWRKQDHVDEWRLVRPTDRLQPFRPPPRSLLRRLPTQEPLRWRAGSCRARKLVSPRRAALS